MDDYSTKNKIKALLALKGMSQRDLAGLVGCTREHLNQALNGGKMGNAMAEWLAAWSGISVKEIKGMRKNAD